MLKHPLLCAVCTAVLIAGSSSRDGLIRAATDRIGVLTYPGMVANAPEWIELDLTGKLIGRWKLEEAATADIRSTSSWKISDAAGSPTPELFLVGARGNNLAFEGRMDGVRVSWVALH